MISTKQKIALEKITGKPWDSWSPEAVTAYFTFTDKGVKPEVPKNARADFDELMECHHFHTITVEAWKYDFVSHPEIGINQPLLFPWDFFNKGYPDSYVKHVLEIYKEVRGSIPIDDVSGCKEEAERLGVPLDSQFIEYLD